MEHKPSGFLSHADGAMQFIAGDSILAIREQPNRGKPLVKTDRRILKDCACLERELLRLVIAIAAIRFGVGHPSDLGSAAVRTLYDAIGPKHENHEPAAILRIGKVLNRLL